MNTQVTAPVVPSAQELYDSIMGDIEPDLLTTNVNTLDAKYTDETSEQKKARADRYNKAFALYQKNYTDYMLDLNRHVTEFKIEMRKHAEQSVREQEEQKLSKLEQDILSA